MQQIAKLIDRLFIKEHEYHGLKLFPLVNKKVRTLFKFVFFYVQDFSSRRSKLSRTKKLRNKFSGVEAILIAGGPSANSLSVQKIQQLQKVAGLKVIAINDFYTSKLAYSITPDVYVLADPGYFEKPQQALWKYLAQNSEILLFIPTSRDLSREVPLHQTYYFNSLGLEGFSNNISPLRPRSFISMTSNYALSIGAFLGVKRLLIIGLENSQFKFLRINSKGELTLLPHHHYEEIEILESLPLFVKSGTAGFFEDCARIFNDFSLFSNKPIENLDRNTLIDAFPIANDWSRFCDE